MHCADFAAGRCRSCSELTLPYPQQLAHKQARAEAALGRSGVEWLPAVASPEAGFRNKAKMAVGGSIEQPSLGLVDPSGGAVDLGNCPLYPAALRAAFGPVRDFITLARIAPYDLLARRGELKFILLTLARDTGQLMLRFVTRSQEPVARIRKHLPALLDALPGLAVVSVNLQPEHKAVLEGDTEIALGPQAHLGMRLNDVPLQLRPQSFFQTNDAIAAKLYAQARAWVAPLDPSEIWDLYCGVGGFALHLASASRCVLGIEASREAVESARRSAADLGVPQVRFEVADASAFVSAAARIPPLVVVNPPRRGIGPALATRLAASELRWLLYSSCNVESLARDIEALSPLQLRRVQVFDMFPHTPHFELLALMQRRPDA